MAIIDKVEMTESVVSTAALETTVSRDMQERKISWPTPAETIKSSFEFLLFATLSGAFCWLVAWVVTTIVARVV